MTASIVIFCQLLVSATPNPSEGGINTFEWPMEQVTLRDGRRLRGLIETAGPDVVEFAEIRRPPGKPMFLIVRPVERATIIEIQRLGAEDREALRDRIRQYKTRARIEARRMEDVTLRAQAETEIPLWTYQGPWFELESTADERTTRQCVVRLEQRFLAFRQALPPRESSSSLPIRLKVFGAQDEYTQFLRSQQMPLRNPAYYVRGKNLIVAGSDVRQIVERVAGARNRHQQLRRKTTELRKKLQNELEQFRKDLVQGGLLNKAKRREIERVVANRVEDDLDHLEDRIRDVEKDNDRAVDQVRSRMLRRLYHEAFHAYLDNHVYDYTRNDVPRWLNEGLAQIFETGLLEADTLRIDAPDPTNLTLLIKDLQEDQPLTLAELLLAEPGAYLIAHDATATTSRRHYLYAWGVVYFLTFENSMLGSSALDEYVHAENPRGPRGRFEDLVQVPLAEFQATWQQAMLELAKRRRK